MDRIGLDRDKNRKQKYKAATQTHYSKTMCPPLCSAGLAAFVNFALLIYAFSVPDWGWLTALIFVVPFAASVTLLIFYWNDRLSYYSGWVLLISGVVKLGFGIFFTVGAAQVGGQDGFFAALGVLVFTIFAIGAGLSAFVDGWAGWSYACRRRPKSGSRLVEVSNV